MRRIRDVWRPTAIAWPGERNHQGIGNELIEAADASGRGEVVCRERLGGLLKFYHHAA